MCVLIFVFLDLQCELVSVIREQHALLAESSSAVAEAMAQINVLDAEKVHLVSVLELVNTYASAMVSEINQLKSAATAEAAHTVSVVAARYLLELELGGKQLDLVTKSREVDDIKSEILAKEELIAQLRLDGGEGGNVAGAQLAALKKELEEEQKNYSTLYEGYETELKEKNEAALRPGLRLKQSAKPPVCRSAGVFLLRVPSLRCSVCGLLVWNQVMGWIGTTMSSDAVLLIWFGA
jgi:hypothetical protein